MNATVSWEDAVRSLIDSPDEAEFVRACYYDQPTEQAAARFLESSEWRRIRRVLGPARGKALDIGAGNGIVSFALAKDGWQAHALEPDPSDLVGAGAIRRLADATGQRIEILSGYGEAIPAPSGTFDVVLARQVMHHANDLAGFCIEVARVLKPGGLLFSWRDHVVNNEAQLPKFFEQHPLHSLYGGENAFTEGQYRSSIEAAGLKINRVWRQFEAAFNYAPKSSYEVSSEVLGKILPSSMAKIGARIFGSDLLFPAFGRMISVVDRRPGRGIAYLASKPLS